ncbi:MAG: hypothetical protein ACFFCW_46890 [Candidatus Hodarchaeota archaeon]
MKRLLLPCLLIFVLLSGCASLQVKREVIDNTFYSSSNPKIQIKVRPEFKYIGETKQTAYRQALFSTRMLEYRARGYIFIDSEGSRVKRAVAITIMRVETKYFGDLYTRIENYYEKGKCKLGGSKFQYCSFLVYPSLSSALTKFITDEGYVLPQCILYKSFARVYAAEGNIAVVISYQEEIPNLPYDCTAWNPDHPLLEDQRAYLEQFNKNCEASFAVLQLGTGKEVSTTAENYQRDVKKLQISKQYDHNNKKYINIQSRQPIYEFGQIKFYAIEGDTLDILLEQIYNLNPRSIRHLGTGFHGICWKVKCRRTGKIGYVSAAMMKMRHQVIEE